MPIPKVIRDDKLLKTAMALGALGWIITFISNLIPPYPPAKSFIFIVLLKTAGYFFSILYLVKHNALHTKNTALQTYNSSILYSISLAIVFEISMQESATYAGAVGLFIILISQLLYLRHSLHSQQVKSNE